MTIYRKMEMTYWVRGRGFDPLSVNGAGRPRASDRERRHGGITVSDQLDAGKVVRRLTKVLGSYSALDMINRSVWLQSFA